MSQEQEKLEYDNDLELASRMQQQFVLDLLRDQETPDVHQLFLYFNQKYFYSKLNDVEVRWSFSMTRDAGTCTFKNRRKRCIVKLSEPLLKFRTKKDLIETLIHEMIHAFLFVTREDDLASGKDVKSYGHGPRFLEEAKRIGDATGFNISIYHTFLDEVDYYLLHIWQCNGVCKNKPPYFGLVKRLSDRPPQLADPWYTDHQLTCGGTYTKIASPTLKRKESSTNTSYKYITASKKMKHK